MFRHVRFLFCLLQDTLHLYRPFHVAMLITWHVIKPRHPLETTDRGREGTTAAEHVLKSNSTSLQRHRNRVSDYSFFSPSSAMGSAGGSSTVALLLSEPVLLSLVPSSAVLSTPSCPLSLSSGVEVPSSPFCWFSVLSSGWGSSGKMYFSASFTCQYLFRLWN